MADGATRQLDPLPADKDLLQMVNISDSKKK